MEEMKSKCLLLYLYLYGSRRLDGGDDQKQTRFCNIQTSDSGKLYKHLIQVKYTNV